MDIYYEIIGEGFPLVLLHGNNEDHHVFDEAVKLLAKEYQCILIDSRYHGQSIHKGDLSYQQMCEDVQAVMTHLHIEAYDVIGFSDGAIVSLLLGLSDQRLKHIVSIGANTKPCMIKPFYRFYDYVMLICLMPFCLYNSKARRTFQLIRLMQKQPQLNYKDLQKIHIPVLVMAGEYDMIKQDDTLMIGKSRPYCVVKIIKQGNHFLLRDSFQQTIKEIQLFLKTCHQEV